MNNLPLTIYLLIPSGIFIFLIGIYSWISTKKREAFIFFLLSITMAIWASGTFFMWRNCGDNQAVIFWDKLLYLAAVFMVPLMYHFSISFAKKESKKKKLIFSSYFLAILLGISTQTKHFIDGVFYYKWGCHTKAQFFHHFFILFAFIFILLSIFNIYKVFKKENKSSSRYSQALFLLVAFSVFSLVTVQLLPPYGIGIYPLFYLGLPVFAFISAYAISQRNLFGYVVATDLLVGAIIIFLLAVLFIPGMSLNLVGRNTLAIFIALACVLLIKYTHQEARRRKRAEEIAEEAKHLNELKNQFLASTQHHLRTPLSAIQGYLSLMREGTYGEIPDKADQKVGKSLNLTKKLINLVNDFLDVAQFNIGGKSFERKDVNLNKLIKEIIDELISEIENKDIELKYDPIQEPIIKSDYSKLKEALYNVVNNAIKYTKEGKVEIRAEKRDNSAIIEVEDTGIGMTEEEVNNLFQNSFERGARAKKANVTGRGIGLFISSQIIEGLGGLLEAHSEGESKGSTFIVKLPIDGKK